MNETDRLLKTGSTNGYDWIVSAGKWDGVLELCPEIVLGKYLAITSLDSGPLVLTEEQQSAGWRSQGGVAYSPAIEHIRMVPHEYFSEFYVFSRPTSLGVLADPHRNLFESAMQESQVHAFVNFDFGLHDPEYAAIIKMFWQQLGWIKAESYVAMNDYVTFVTARRELFAKMYERLK